MIDFEEAQVIALKYARENICKDCILYGGTELTDSWVFNFANSEKCFIPGTPLRVFIEDGKCELFPTLDHDGNAKEYREKRVARFVLTDGCHW